MTSMIRPTWTAENERQREALARAVQLAEKSKEAEETMWAAIVAARNLGIPDTVLCERTGQSRATLNRKFGARPTPVSTRPADRPK